MNHCICNMETDPISRDAVRIDRGTPLGSPYAIGPDGDRDTVIERYRVWLQARIAERDPVVCTALLGIRPGQPLACHCAPKRCHGEVIAEVLDNGTVSRLREAQKPTTRYAGIGSRTAPPKALLLLQRIATRLEERNYTLLSGGAPGADSAFAAGVSDPERKQIFLPWQRFNEIESKYSQPESEAFRVAMQLHPAWNRLTDRVKALLARNCHQVLGADLRSPVDFVVCWTLDGCEREATRTQSTGGTGLAIALADRWGIPVVNLRNGEDRLQKIRQMIDRL